MQLEDIKNTYQILAQTIEILQKEFKLSYFDALIETLSNLLENEINGSKELNKQSLQKLQKLYGKLNFLDFSSEEIRQVIQLLILASYKKEIVQPNHQMTPDSIGYLLTFLIEKIVSQNKRHSLLDITVGTGNLLSVVLNNLKTNGIKNIKVYGVDNDGTLLAIADVSSALQHNEIDFYHQDAMSDFMFPPVDIVIGDLPVGYYPLDKRVKNFQTHASGGHSYAHYVLIEKALNHLNSCGWGFFIVPSQIFETKKAQVLLKTIQKVGYLQGLLNLPYELFNSPKAQKAIMLVQKQGPQAYQVPQVLLGDFPSLKDKKEFNHFLDEINLWVNENLNK